jgi:hypothetical protein
MFEILSTYSCWKKIYKMQHLEGSGTPVLYIGRTVLKGWVCEFNPFVRNTDAAEVGKSEWRGKSLRPLKETSQSLWWLNVLQTKAVLTVLLPFADKSSSVCETLVGSDSAADSRVPYKQRLSEYCRWDTLQYCWWDTLQYCRWDTLQYCRWDPLQ